MPTWKDPPEDKTVDCDELTEEDTNPEPELEYDNNVEDPPDCHITGSVAPEVTSDYGPCGGRIVKVWKFEDPCSYEDTGKREIKHVQVITVSPSDEGEWIDAPEDEEKTCAQGYQYYQAGPTQLSYENYADGEYDGCRVNGAVTGYICADINYCEGTIEQTWTADDTCRRVLDHTQTITTTQADAADWVDPPNDDQINCAAARQMAQQLPENFKLNYDNQLTGPCRIYGEAIPTIEIDVDECGGTVTRTWEFEDQCSRKITHVQTLTADPTPQAQWLYTPPSQNMLCAFAYITLRQPIGLFRLYYWNGVSENPGCEKPVCRIAGYVEPTIDVNINWVSCTGTITRTWLFIDLCGRQLQHIQVLTITPT